jgi:hypothetical protein
MVEYFTFVADTVPALNYLVSTAASEFVSPFTRTVAGGTEWEVDAVTHRLKYVGTKPKIYRMNARFQQTSSSTIFRPNVQTYSTFPMVEGNSQVAMAVTSGSSITGIMNAYPPGYFFTAQPNAVYGFTTENRQTSAGTSSDWILTIYLNELR